MNGLFQVSKHEQWTSEKSRMRFRSWAGYFHSLLSPGKKCPKQRLLDGCQRIIPQETAVLCCAKAPPWLSILSEATRYCWRESQDGPVVVEVMDICMDSHQENADFSHTHRIYVWYIYLYLQSAIHVGKYTLRPMDPGIRRICPQRFRMAISPITELKGGSTWP